MSLQTYQKKRVFQKTPEPYGRKNRPSSRRNKLHFVVQKHAASHLHYDFRLELNGVLKSWAIPKGPSLNPKNKRLAMQVEDHPLEYRHFEGIIPEGNYGAGAVMIWDEGTYAVDPDRSVQDNETLLKEGLRAGKLSFVLEGHKLKGRFSLVKATGSRYGKENAWLLIKADDDHASSDEILLQDQSIRTHRSLNELRSDVTIQKPEKTALKIPPGAKKAKMPHHVKPMLSTLVDSSFDREGWLFELKLDGYRCITEIQKGNVAIYSRNFLSFRDRFPSVYQALLDLQESWKKELNIDSLMLDGEVVAVDDTGKPNFQLLQDEMQNQARLIYYVFDLLYLNGYDLRSLPLRERKTLLQTLLPTGSGIVRYCEHIETQGRAFFQEVSAQGLEGIMTKAADSPYLSGKRSGQWLKIKAHRQQEAVICGFTKPRGSRKKIGALILGAYKNSTLHYIGHTGTGMADRDLNELYEQLQALKVEKSPFLVKPKTNEKPTWVQPKLVCEIRFAEWTKDGIMRQPVYLGLRMDKTHQDVQLEHEKPLETLIEDGKKASKNSQSHRKKFSPEAPANRDWVLRINHHTVRITHPNKVLWPQLGYRKKDLVNYYREMTPWILPYLKDRPFVLNRFPDGIDGDSFYQKDMSNQTLPAWVESMPIFSESDQEVKKYLLCQNEETLLLLASWGCIEMNPWNSRRSHLDKPDWMVLDLDPGDIDFEYVIEAAQIAHQILADWKVPSYCKTSGATGLHVYVPMGAQYNYETVKTFAQLVAGLVHQELPKFTSLERSPSKRKTKIYLDYLQNRYGQTLVAPYSLRPTPEATVSTPLHWEEVKRGLRPQQFTTDNIPGRVRQEGDLWQPVLGKGVDLQRLIKRLSD